MMNELDIINVAYEALEVEIKSLMDVRDHFNSDSLKFDFLKILNLIKDCSGKLVIIGAGKSGHIGRKISATMASLGTSSFFLHPNDAVHGDLGMIQHQDIVFFISYSGETDELIKLIPYVKSIGCKIICITGNRSSSLVRNSYSSLILPPIVEACNLSLAPTSSTTAMLVIGDILAICLSRLHGFNEKHFALNHPSGNLGKKLLLLVDDIMHSTSNNSVVRSGVSIKDAILEMSKKSLAIVNIIDYEGKLIGVFTDGDLRRIFAGNIDIYNEPIDSVMTTNPKVIHSGSLAIDALNLLKTNNISAVPVLDGFRLIGSVRIMDIVKSGIDL